MGILNVTPDSFRDGGRFLDPQSAVTRGLQMWEAGAAVIDVGAESTRPGARRVDQDEEWSRLEPVLTPLVAAGITLSVDTVNASTAERALAMGVEIINDISGGCYDPAMNRVISESDARFVIQHWRGFPSDPELDCDYTSIEQVLEETLDQVSRAEAAGVAPERIIIDPGLGFALRSEDCWRILDTLGSWVATGYPVLVGASHKRFLAERFGTHTLEGTRIVTALAADAGVWAVRVHDVAENMEVA